MIEPYQMNKGNLNPLNGDEIVLQNYALNAASNVFGLNGTVVRSTLLVKVGNILHRFVYVQQLKAKNIQESLATFH